MKRARERGSFMEKTVTTVYHNAVTTSTRSTTIFTATKACELIKVKVTNSGTAGASGIAQGVWAIVRRPDGDSSSGNLHSGDGEATYVPAQEYILGGTYTTIDDTGGYPVFWSTEERMIESWERCRTLKEGDKLNWKAITEFGSMGFMAVVEIWTSE